MAGGDAGISVDRSPIIPGGGELSEAAPLKVRGGGAGGGGWCAGGPRLILACFAALSAAITLALFTQIYYNDYEVVPHGGVSCDAAACALAGTDALKAGGRALDAAAAAALCLAVLAPHATSLDASGSLLYWEYRGARAAGGAGAGGPQLAEWGPAGAGGGGPQPAEWGPAAGAAPPPRLLAALAVLHAAHGALPWRDVLQPAISLAKSGFEVGAGLAAALAAAGAPVDAGGGGGGGAGGAFGALEVASGGARASAPRLAAYLEGLQRNTSAELSASWGAGAVRVSSEVAGGAAGGGRVFVGGPRAAGVQRALAAALSPPPATLDEAEARAVAALQAEPAPAPRPLATGLAVVDSSDAYVALVTGLSAPFGSGPAAAGGAWRRDAPPAPLDLAPAILVDEHVCGTRYVVGAAHSAALAAVGAALAAGGGAGAVERPRPAAVAEGSVNVLQQSGDALVSHADSRGGGLASRF